MQYIVKNMCQFFITKYVSFQPDTKCINFDEIMCQFFISLNLTQKCVNISDFEILTKLCVKISI